MQICSIYYKNLEVKLTIERTIFIKLQNNLSLFFSSRDEQIKAFRRSLEAIKIAFVRRSYQLQEITFQNKQKTVMPKNTFLQAW